MKLWGIKIHRIAIVSSDRNKSYEVANKLAEVVTDFAHSVSVNEFGLVMYDYLRKLSNLLVEKNEVEIEVGTYFDYITFLNMEDLPENKQAVVIITKLRELIFKILNYRNYYDEIIILHDREIESDKHKTYYELCGEKAIIIKNSPSSIVVKAILRNVKIRTINKCLLCNKESELENGRCSECR